MPCPPPTNAARLRKCRGGMKWISRLGEWRAASDFASRHCRLDAVRLGRATLLHRHHHLHLRALFCFPANGRSRTWTGGLGLYADRRGDRDCPAFAGPRRNCRCVRPTKAVDRLFRRREDHLARPALERGTGLVRDLYGAPSGAGDRGRRIFHRLQRFDDDAARERKEVGRISTSPGASVISAA